MHAAYTVEEVRKALFSLLGRKAPGPDGFGSYFYRDFWPVVGEEIIVDVLEILQNGRILKKSITL